MEKAVESLHGRWACGALALWVCRSSEHLRACRLLLKFMCRVGAVLLLCVLNACSTLSSTATVSVERNQPFALLAFNNLSVTPQAEDRLRTLVEMRLRRKGVADVHVYSPSNPTTLQALFDTRAQGNEATRWAINQGARYGIRGTVHEWQYQRGADGEPTVGITLSLVDLTNGSVIWQGNAARTGLGYANLSAIADKTTTELLDKVRFVAPVTGARQIRGE